LSLGDDSGIEVDALDAAPGLSSARFGAPGLDDTGRYRLLLERLHGVPAARRTARFRCVIALVDPDGGERIVGGVGEGAGAGWRGGARARARTRHAEAAASATTPCSSIRRWPAPSASSRSRSSTPWT